MNSIENMLCIFCKNSTIISTDKPSNYDYNSSNEDTRTSSLYSICTTCNKYSYINENTLLYNEVLSKSSSRLVDIKYDPKLIQLKNNCTICKKETTFKMFANNNNDQRYKYICTECNTFFSSI